MEMDLKNIQWSEFVFEDIFKINSTNSGIDKNKLNEEKGIIPYITMALIFSLVHKMKNLNKTTEM